MVYSGRQGCWGPRLYLFVMPRRVLLSWVNNHVIISSGWWCARDIRQKTCQKRHENLIQRVDSLLRFWLMVTATGRLMLELVYGPFIFDILCIVVDTKKSWHRFSVTWLNYCDCSWCRRDNYVSSFSVMMRIGPLVIVQEQFIDCISCL